MNKWQVHMLLSNMIIISGLSVLLIPGCSEEPVLTGIEPATVLDDIPSAQERIDTPKEIIYQKKEGIYIDVLYLGGLDRQLHQGEVASQFGNLQQTVELPMRQGTQYIYDKGSLYTFEGRIYRMDIALPEHVR